MPTRTHTYICTHAYTHTDRYRHTHKHMPTRTHTHTHTHTHTLTQPDTHTRLIWFEVFLAAAGGQCVLGKYESACSHKGQHNCNCSAELSRCYLSQPPHISEHIHLAFSNKHQYGTTVMLFSALVTTELGHDRERQDCLPNNWPVSLGLQANAKTQAHKMEA